MVPGGISVMKRDIFEAVVEVVDGFRALGSVYVLSLLA